MKKNFFAKILLHNLRSILRRNCDKHFKTIFIIFEYCDKNLQRNERKITIWKEIRLFSAIG